MCEKRISRRGGIGLLAAMTLAVWLAFELWQSYALLSVRAYEVPVDGLTEDIRVAVLADLHGSAFGDDNAVLLARLIDCAPDLIVMDGDMLNEDADSAQAVCLLIERAREIAPVYYALGNHEKTFLQTHGELLTQLTAAGAVVLEQAYEDVVVRGQAIRIGGMYDYAFAMDGKDSTDPERMDPAVYRFLTAFQDTDACKLMLSHRPDSFVFGEAADTWDAGLVISGHVHGGQVVLPFVGGLWSPDQGWFPTYDHGVFSKGKLQIAVTAGLGSQSESLPRFHNPPEIMLLTLQAHA